AGRSALDGDRSCLAGGGRTAAGIACSPISRGQGRWKVVPFVRACCRAWRLRDLCCTDKGCRRSWGEFRLHVEARSLHLHSTVFLFSGAILLTALAGCHRPPSPDVMATVNGKDILRNDVEKYYKANLGANPQSPSPEQASIVRLKLLD